jgi:AraC-like DNA-binding protein
LRRWLAIMNDATVALPIQFQFAPVAPELATGLLIYWEVETKAAEPIEDLMHPDWANIRFQLGGDWSYGLDRSDLAPVTDFATVTGTTDRGYWARSDKGSGFCVMLYPQAWSRILQADASTYANNIHPLSAVLGAQADIYSRAMRETKSFAERVAVSDNFFKKLWDRNGPDPQDSEIMTIFAALNDPDCTAVEHLQERTGMSHNRLNRLTKRTYGMSPKMLLRRERFLRMMRTMEVRSFREWQAFLDPQYVDQSHMIRDFKRFIGLAPSHYFAMKRPMLESSIAALQKLWMTGWDPLQSGPEALDHGG